MWMRIFGLSLSVVISGAQAMAQEKAAKSNLEEPVEARLTYPELEVTPRASERLEIEARRERSYRWFTNSPILFSSLLTIAVSNQADASAEATVEERENFDERKKHSLYVGSALFLTTVGLAAGFRPYQSGYDEIKNMPAKSQREQLTRERLAEEALYRPSTLATTLKWMSVLSQVAVNARLVENGTDRAKTFAGLGVLAAMSPLIFESTWVSVAENHKSYKKKIYGPLSGLMPLQDADQSLTLGAGFSWTF
jgi:hypothetical protein